MSHDRHELRRQIGIALRAVPVAVLALGWYLVFWWWIVLLSVAAAIVDVLLQPVAYPFLYAGLFLVFAFKNSREEILPGYWSGYPGDSVKRIEKSLKLGSETLRRWLFRGFGV
jgi:hypothetical protein